MKISYNWLNNYFDDKLPQVDAVVDALTFHSFEVDGVENVGDTISHMDKVLDVKVTPNRGHDCLSHRAIALELSAAFSLPFTAERDPFAHTPDLSKKTDALRVSVENAALCPRFSAVYMTGVQVGPSPEWLKNSLEAIGQRSINNIVDITNLVMFNTGQPLHAFDAGKLAKKDGVYALSVRTAKKGETMLGLDDKEYALEPWMLTIADGHTDEVMSLAGVKGGKPTGIDERTTEVIFEAANWDGVTIRKTSQALKLRTDASDRFQQVISPELTAYGLQQAIAVTTAIAGGHVEGFVDVYPDPQRSWTVAVSTQKVNAVLGTALRTGDIADSFTRLGLPFVEHNDSFIVTPPFQRLDLVIPEDLIEEVGRTIGYDKVPSTPLDVSAVPPERNAYFDAAELAREKLMNAGYSEVVTSVFAEKGERIVANKVDGVRPYLRATLLDGLQEALERNVHTKAILGLTEVKLFEIGTIWQGGKELIVVGTVGEKEKPTECPLEASDTHAPALPLSPTKQYKPFSRYPFIVRDIAMWIPESPTAFSDAVTVFADHNHGLLQHVDLFDQYHKNGRVSYAFHLVFQSFEKTLTDEEANAVMEEIYAAVKAKGWEVR